MSAIAATSFRQAASRPLQPSVNTHAQGIRMRSVEGTTGSTCIPSALGSQSHLQYQLPKATPLTVVSLKLPQVVLSLDQSIMMIP